VPEDEGLVLADESRLRQALENLLDNAVKFNREGGFVHVELGLEASRAGVQVKDGGIGIPPEDQERLFSRFYRGSNAADLPGSGLGLAIVKAVAESHGGSVTLESGPGGSEFRLSLPLAPNQPPAHPLPAPA
jgi:signal transduction histidine kinase